MLSCKRSGITPGAIGSSGVAGLAAILILAVHLWSGGCGIMDSDDSDGTTGPLEGKVSFSISDGWMDHGSEGPPELLLDMETEQIYGCCNYSIQTEIRTVADSVVVTIHGIYKPDVCATALGPATWRGRLPLASGTYHLRIGYRSEHDTYRLVVTDSSLTMHGSAGDLSAPSDTITWRIPESSFACFCAAPVDLEWICDDFIDSLLAFPVMEFTFSDSGATPHPWGNRESGHDLPPRYFLYGSEAEYDSAGALLARFKRDVIADNEGVNIWLWSWRNRHHRSWLLSR